MIRRLIYIILVSFFFVSCFVDTPKITLRNNTTKKIDSIKVGISQKYPTYFYEILPNESVSGSISEQDKSLGDGAYFLEIYYADKTSRKERFGYYTNGHAVNSLISLEIKNDTIIFEMY